MKENGIKHVTFSTADGALEAAPAVRFYSICISALEFDLCSLTILLSFHKVAWIWYENV